jgi:hypothetical protein
MGETLDLSERREAKERASRAPRPTSVPEARGMKPVPPERTRKYSPESYAAQYGVTVEDARELIGAFADHAGVRDEIHRMLGRDEALRRRAFLLDDPSGVTPNEEEVREEYALLKRLKDGADPWRRTSW